MKFAATVGIAILSFASNAAIAQYARALPFDTSVTQIKKAMSPSTTGIQHFRWVSLRLLADPAMNPLFESLTQSKDVALKIDGFMGMALVNEQKSLNAQRVNQLRDPPLRRLLITEALGLDLLKPAAIDLFLREPDLTNYERALLVAELQRQKQPWDKSLLLSTANDEAIEVAGLASMLLLERGDDSGWQSFTNRLQSLPADQQVELRAQMANAARQYQITSAVEPLLLNTRDSTGNDRFSAVQTAVALSPTTGRGAVLEKIKSDRTQSNLVKMGLLMLSTKSGFEAVDFDAIRNGDPLVEAMANAGVAMRNGSADLEPALCALVNNGNRSTKEFVVSVAPTLAPSVSQQILLNILDEASKRETLRADEQLSILLATQQLLRMADSHERLRAIALQSAEKNIGLLEIIMSVVADTIHPDTAGFARSLRGQLPRRGESMALLALAKNTTPLTAAEIAELGSIASGGGKVDDSSQIQAAWLYLKYANREKDAIEQLTR